MVQMTRNSYKWQEILTIIWLSFMVHICKMIISLGVLFTFPKFWFSRSIGGFKGKNGPEWQKILSVAFVIWWTIHHMIVIMVQMYKIIISPHVFFNFKILIFGVFKELKGQNMAQSDKKILSVSLHISGIVHHMIVIFGADV